MDFRPYVTNNFNFSQQNGREKKVIFFSQQKICIYTYVNDFWALFLNDVNFKIFFAQGQVKSFIKKFLKEAFLNFQNGKLHFFGLEIKCFHRSMFPYFFMEIMIIRFNFKVSSFSHCKIQFSGKFALLQWTISPISNIILIQSVFSLSFIANHTKWRS